MAPVAKKRRIGRNGEQLQTRRGGARRDDSRRTVKSLPNETFAVNERIAATVSDDDSSDSDVVESHAAKRAYSGLLSALQVSTGGSKLATRRSLSPGQKDIQRHSRDDDQKKTDSKILADAEQDNMEDLEAIGLEEEADSEEDDATDPFEAHFGNPDDKNLTVRLDCISSNHWTTTQTKSKLGKHITKIPLTKCDETTAKVSIGRSNYKLKRRLQEPFKDVLPTFIQANSTFGPAITTYQDLLYCGRTVGNAAGLRTIACVHALNHILKTRDRIIKNTARLVRDQNELNLELRDQGFTRPKVLVLLETRQACARYMETITQLFRPEQQENKKRFEDAFVNENVISDDQPPDFCELFEGNNDNEFRLGVKFTRKTLKYYSQFYSSDIILASPLGLRRAINAEDPKKSDHDFLSSIELLIIDQADAMLMQNWEHVEFALEHINLQPSEAHGCDFSRVRKWYLDQNARHLRQTIIFSAYLTPELNSLFSSHMVNVAGKVKVVPENDGAIMNIGAPVRQTFNRFACRSPLSEPDDRFKFFTTTIIPLLNRELDPSQQGLGALIFIPSYLDFVRVRNFFSTSPDTQNLSFGSISEYTEKANARRARSHFFLGRQCVMLYTGRAHHFHRYRVRGVKRVIMYGLPANPAFYEEMVAGFIGTTMSEAKTDAGGASAKILFSRWDGLALERIVGSERVAKMLKEGGEDIFEFT